MSAVLKRVTPALSATGEEDRIIAEALAILERRHARGEALTSPEATKAYLRLRLGERLVEVFGVILLDNRNRVIGIEELFTGTIDAAPVYPRVVVQRGLERNAAAMVAFHNHPSVDVKGQAKIGPQTLEIDFLAQAFGRLAGPSGRR